MFRLLKLDPKSNEFVYHLDEQNDRILVKFSDNRQV